MILASIFVDALMISDRGCVDKLSCFE
ncbi:Protein of unknown function [Pyronema omphalodes CBS 100304]|uniref:Uncharacterized protein n=1 Tax=Pyronema omphalodes (strain CBS 100304) TaxID=1076935 RepID=U4L8B1_PYROM|nr:Protein of unknown function [Pyronema omphalodes CBS 100304]